MTRIAIVTDLALAVFAATVVLILTPGVAIAAMIAIFVLAYRLQRRSARIAE